MAAKKLVPLLFFLSAIGALFVYGLSKEENTFGVEGTLVFEGDNAAGATVVYTTGDQSPLGKDPSSFVREVVLQDGQFFRPINEFGGEDVHIWVYKEGYPVFNVSRVLNPNQKNIDFGNIYIPKTLKAGAIAGGGAAKPIQAYSDMCLKDRAGQFAPADIRCILDYTVQDEAGSRCGQPYQKVYGAEFLFKSPQSVSSGVRIDRIFLFFGQ